MVFYLYRAWNITKGYALNDQETILDLKKKVLINVNFGYPSSILRVAKGIELLRLDPLQDGGND